MFSFHFVAFGSPLPRVSPQTLPFFGVVPAILNESGEELEGPSEGYLVSLE